MSFVVPDDQMTSNRGSHAALYVVNPEVLLDKDFCWPCHPTCNVGLCRETAGSSYLTSVLVPEICKRSSACLGSILHSSHLMIGHKSGSASCSEASVLQLESFRLPSCRRLAQFFHVKYWTRRQGRLYWLREPHHPHPH